MDDLDELKKINIIDMYSYPQLELELPKKLEIHY